MSEDLTKKEKVFVDSFMLSKHDEARNISMNLHWVNREPMLKYITNMEAMEKKYEELKNDVKRYFELDEKFHVDRLTILEAQEKVELAIKLSKVGDEK